MNLHCAVCNKEGVGDLKACSACKGIFYCSPEHQKENWPSHKTICSKIKQALNAGFVKDITSPGEEGKLPKHGSQVHVTYVGRFADGTIFDQSKEDSPFTFRLGTGDVIRGWDACVATMTKGEKATVYISPQMGYGPTGAGDVIPGNSPLIFDIHLLSFG